MSDIGTRRQRPWPVILVALLCGGCVPDLGGYAIAPGPGPDGSMPPPGRCAPTATCTGGCPLPWLLASVEDLGDGCGGQVWRWSLTGTDGDFCVCGALDAGGAIPRLPFSVGFAPPATVVVAAESDRVMAIDGRTDTVIWEASYEPQPVDIFAIEDLSGRLMVGVAGRPRGGDIRNVDFYDAALGGEPIRRTTNGDLPLGLGVAGITQSPFGRTWMRALRSDGMYAAADVDPWSNTRFDMPLHTMGRDGFFLHTIHASFDGAFHRTVWTGERSDLADRPTGIYRLALSADMGDNRVPLSDNCDEAPDCEWIHAVADPALNTSSIGLCQYAPGERRILRVRSIGACTPIVDQAEIYVDARISRLALAQDTFWAP